MLQTRVGLTEVNLGAIRRTEHHHVGQFDYCINGGVTHQQGLTEARAEAVFQLIPVAVRNTPPNADAAHGIGQIALMAGRSVPDGCEAFLRTAGAQVRPEKCSDYLTPGGFFFTTKRDTNTFIVFLDNNQDEGHRVVWYDMTGREQFEWYEAFLAAGKTHNRVALTVGLRGTNLARLVTRAQVQAALLRSPSLSRRRPAHHVVPNHQWPDPVVRNLFG